jgi:hypothetical protein
MVRGFHFCAGITALRFANIFSDGRPGYPSICARDAIA